MSAPDLTVDPDLPFVVTGGVRDTVRVAAENRLNEADDGVGAQR